MRGYEITEIAKLLEAGKPEEAIEAIHKAMNAWVADKVAALSDRERKALLEAVSAVYFGETHKHGQKLWAVIGALCPELFTLLEKNPEQAYNIVAGGPDGK